MKPRLYIETTIVSYLTARLSRDLIMAAKQQLTADWWQTRRADFDCVVSQLVIDEAAAGNADAARRRLDTLKAFPKLEASGITADLAKQLIHANAIPPAAAADAVHVALASVHGIHFLLTWNFRHLANASQMDMNRQVCLQAGYGCPVICTPEELMQGQP